jgi:hypothetical protein
LEPVILNTNVVTKDHSLLHYHPISMELKCALVS